MSLYHVFWYHDKFYVVIVLSTISLVRMNIIGEQLKEKKNPAFSGNFTTFANQYKMDPLHILVIGALTGEKYLLASERD